MGASICTNDYPQQDCSLYSSRAKFLRVIRIGHLDAPRRRYATADLVRRDEIPIDIGPEYLRVHRPVQAHL